MDIEKLSSNERRVAEDRPTCAGVVAAGRPVCQSTGRRDCYWLYIVTGCKSQPNLQERIKNPARFPWHQVKKVDHYYLSVDALTQPMQVNEQLEPYGDGKPYERCLSRCGGSMVCGDIMAKSFDWF